MVTGFRDLKAGDQFTGYCVVRKKELKRTREGATYLNLELGDRSGRWRAKIWQEAEILYRDLHIRQILKIQGKIRTYRQVKELQVEKLRIVQNQEEVASADLIPTSKKEILPLQKQLNRHRQSLTNEYLAQLLNTVFPDDGKWESYQRMPAGKLWHHNYRFGNLEHLVCLLDLADVLSRHYPNINLDLLKTGILLHNLGNSQEFDCRGFIDYSSRARLLGHTQLNCWQLRDAVEKVKDFPEELSLQLYHLIISQDDNPEKKGYLMPMTLEAIVLNMLINLDIYTNAAGRVIRSDRVEGSPWTRFNNLFQRFMYAGISESGNTPVKDGLADNQGVGNTERS